MPYQQLSAADRLRQQQEIATATAQQSVQKFNAAQDVFNQHQQDYITGKRNPIADLLKKPERDVQKEARLKQVAAIGAIGDAVGLIGKGYAAARGVKPQKTEGGATYKALGELQRLDDIYRQENYNYDHQMMLDGLRRKETADKAQQAAVGLAGQERNYQRGKLDQAAQMTLNSEMIAEREAIARKERAAERSQDRAHDTRMATMRLRATAAEDHNTNPLMSGSANSKVKGLYSVPFFGRQVQITPAIQQQVLEYMAEHQDPMKGEFEWTKVVRDPKLQNQVGKALEAMKITEQGGDDVDAARAIANSVSKAVIPRLYNIKTVKERTRLLDEFFSQIPPEAIDLWIDLNMNTLEELGLSNYSFVGDQRQRLPGHRKATQAAPTATDSATTLTDREQIAQNNTMVASAKDLKANGYTSLSVASLRNMTGEALKNISDKDIIEQYAKGGVSVTNN